jgi:uncharacterized membrane protein YqjE
VSTSDPYPVGETGTAETGTANGAPASVGELVGEVARDLSTLMRQELELAKAEIKQEAARAGKGAGLLGGAGYTGHLFVLFLSVALMAALDVALPLWAAALIVAVLWAAAAAVLATTGRKNLRSVNPKPQQTIDTLKEDVQWAKHPTR